MPEATSDTTPTVPIRTAVRAPAVALVLTVVALAGCGTATEATTPEAQAKPAPQEASPATPIEPTPTEQPGDVAETAYVEVLHGRAWFARVPASTLLEFGHTTCDALDAGVSPIELVAMAPDSGMPVNQAAFAVGSAIGALCPDHMGLLDEIGAAA